MFVLMISENQVRTDKSDVFVMFLRSGSFP